MSALTLTQLRQLAALAGFPDPSLAAAVAMAESRGNPAATNIHGAMPGALPERSFGLWQINTLAHPQFNESQLLDPTYNAQAAFQVSSGGKNWTPWSTYTHGDYRAYMPPATAADWLTFAALAAAALLFAMAANVIRTPRALERLVA